jgi:hypothetical protein
MAIALGCVLSGVIHAGEIHTTGIVSPPPPGTVTVTCEGPETGITTADEIAAEESTTALTIIVALFSIVS